MDREAATVKEALKQREENLPPNWTMYYEDQQHLPRALANEGIRADAVAVGPEGGIVFEVVIKRSPKSREKIQRLEHLSQSLASTPGWKLEVIIASERAALASQADMAERIRTAESMVLMGRDNQHILQAAYLLGFSALEGSIARLVIASDLPYSPNAARMTESLISRGLWPQEQYTRVALMQSLRNKIAHAESTSSAVSATQVLDLLSETRRIANQVAEIETH